MIYFYTGYKCKKRKYKTSDHIIEAENIADFNNKEEFDERIEKGDDVYYIIITYDGEPERYLMWFNTQEDADSYYWQLMDEI